MIDVSTSIEIERSADDVFAFVSEFPNNPRWQRGQVACTWTSDPPPRVGSTYEQHARFLGRDMINSFEVVEHVPGRSVRFRSTSGTFPLIITRTVEPLGPGRARFTERAEGDPGRFFGIASPALRRLVQRSIRRDFPVLKALLENTAARP